MTDVAWKPLENVSSGLEKANADAIAVQEATAIINTSRGRIFAPLQCFSTNINNDGYNLHELWRAFDGDVSTDYFVQWNNLATAQGYYLAYFGQPTRIQTGLINFHVTGSCYWDFLFEYSEDGQTWKKLSSLQYYNSPPAVEGFLSAVWEDFTAKYFRISFTGIPQTAPLMLGIAIQELFFS